MGTISPARRWRAFEHMKVTPLGIEGVLLVELVVHEDYRGFFIERFQIERFREQGLPTVWVQDNHSRSKPGGAPWPPLPAHPATGQARRGAARPDLGRRRGHPPRLAYLWPARRRRAERHERPAALDIRPASPTASASSETSRPTCCTAPTPSTAPAARAASPGTIQTWPCPGRSPIRLCQIATAPCGASPSIAPTPRPGQKSFRPPADRPDRAPTHPDLLHGRSGYPRPRHPGHPGQSVVIGMACRRASSSARPSVR